MFRDALFFLLFPILLLIAFVMFVIYFSCVSVGQQAQGDPGQSPSQHLAGARTLEGKNVRLGLFSFF